MATLKGAIRSYGATVRRIEREQQRQARESAKRFKEQQKLQEIKDAQQAVSDWKNYVETLQSVHKNCTEQIDWEKIENTKKPISPSKESSKEDYAKIQLENFKPSFFDKLFGLTEKKINGFKKQIEVAKNQDQKDYNIKHKEYLDQLLNWTELQKISAGIRKKQSKSYRGALQYFNPFSDIKELGTEINFNFNSNYIDIDLHVNSLEIIPNYELKQTSTGKLSKKNMPKSRFNELYQDHICSSAIRIARETFAYLPVDYVRVNAISKIVNSSTGHLEDRPILSVILTQKTIRGLNLETIDPSDSMRNFLHNMIFNKIKGFAAVEKVELEK